ncbi:MAG: hypothetical protein JWO89_770 [Verrucomicrobiaceae bacterium]|nr:hypothetical protein [Verrucomicrobiaceae bacterium]MDB6118011.1 hypothetical protein [Verrucomicrobiaceae bacterium]
MRPLFRNAAIGLGALFTAGGSWMMIAWIAGPHERGAFFDALRLLYTGLAFIFIIKDRAR